jgi:hypothetical protein
VVEIPPPAAESCWRLEKFIMSFKLQGAVAALALLVSAAPSLADEVQFEVINNSSHSVHYFYTNPSHSDNWGDDLLGENGTLESGEAGVVTIHTEEGQCDYDFRFETGQGGLLEAFEVNICELDSYTLSD